MIGLLPTFQLWAFDAVEELIDTGAGLREVREPVCAGIGAAIASAVSALYCWT